MGAWEKACVVGASGAVYRGGIEVEECSEGGGALGQEGAMHVVPVVPTQCTLSSLGELNACAHRRVNALCEPLLRGIRDATELEPPVCKRGASTISPRDGALGLAQVDGLLDSNHTLLRVGEGA